jgi:hypothetical protein
VSASTKNPFSSKSISPRISHTSAAAHAIAPAAVGVADREQRVGAVSGASQKLLSVPQTEVWD